MPHYKDHNYSIELELLLLCLKDRLSGSDAKRIISLCKKTIDWEAFIYLTIRHNVLPIVYKRLKDNYSPFLTNSLLQKMKAFFISNAARNLIFTITLQDILDILKKEGIKCIPLKGPVISEQLYGDINFRVFSDLDILVPEDKAFSAFELLISKKFSPELNLNADQFAAYMKTEDHIILSAHKPGINVELHWELSARYLSNKFTYKQIKEHTRSIDFYKKRTIGFSNEDLLVYLCVHGSKHIWETFEMLFQIACLLKGDLNWERILLLSKSINCRKKLMLGLSLSTKFFNSFLPDHIHSMLKKEKNIVQLTSYVEKILTTPHGKIVWEISKSKFANYQFQTFDRFQDKIRYLFFIVFVPTNNDWAVSTLPADLSFIYYIIRPFRLAKNFANHFLQKNRAS